MEKNRVKELKNNLENDINIDFEFDIVDEYTETEDIVSSNHVILRYNNVVVTEDIIDFEKGSDHYKELVEILTEFIKQDSNGK